jgi:hypothetical protein
MNIQEALTQADSQSELRETLHVVGSIERDSASDTIRVYPNPHDLSHYLLVNPEHIDGEVLDVTEHVQRTDPARRGPVFSVPLRRGAEIQIVAMKTIQITDVAKMRFLSLDQSGGCGCGRSGKETSDGVRVRPYTVCYYTKCYTITGEGPYFCVEIDEDTGYSYCSGCCYVA